MPLPEDPAKNGNPTPEGGNTPGPVPYAVFAATNTELNTLKAEKAAWQTREAELTQKAATADTLATSLREKEAAFAKERDGWAAEKELIAAGITDTDGQEVALMLYRKLPEKDRSTIIGMIQGMAKDVSKAPKPMQPYLTAAQADPAKGAKKEGGKEEGREVPTTPARKGEAPPAGEVASAETIRAARLKAQKTGNWDEFRSLTGTRLGTPAPK